MATYIALCRFTDQGIRSVKDTTKRAAAAQEAAGRFGARMQLYWTLGQYDLVTIIDAADEQSASAFALSITSAGNIRMETMRAFNSDEMGGILGKLP
jgi:uncharacterized protein with GYD domain